MKDTDARYEIDGLRERVKRLESTRISLRYCPECKHETLMRRGSYCALWFEGPPPEKTLTCTVCGKNFTDGLVVLEEAP